MKDATELAATIWPIYESYFGQLNTPETRLAFRADVHAAIGPDSDEQRLVCDAKNNPPTLCDDKGFAFDLFFKSDGMTFQLSSYELIRAYRADML